MKKKHFLSLILFFPLLSNAQAVNWAEDIAPILYDNCTRCHHTGGMGPFSLITYNDAVAVQLGMQDAVNNKRMPPWPPDPSYVSFAHERLLDAAEITAINDWVNNGTPSGNLSLAPPPPVYNNLSQMPQPDLSLVIPTYSVGSTSDIYRCFPLLTGLSVKKFIQAMEVIPGNPSIVHHVLVFADNSNACHSLDSADPGPGYTNFGGPGSGSAKLIGAWVPGADPYILPPGMGISLDSATNVIVQVHYPAGSLGMIDTTRVNFRLTTGSLREVSIMPILNHATTLVNGPLVIQPNTTKTFHEKYTTPSALDISLLGVAPHMHLIGRNFRSYGITPVNDTIPIIKINNWDFRWQGYYSFKKVLKIPGGTDLHAYALYDNTSNNLFNPNTPPQIVYAGESTTDEMMLEYFFFLPYQAGDENISQDSLTLTGLEEDAFSDFIITPQLYEPYPNPSNGMVSIDYYLPRAGRVTLHLTDLNGKLAAVLHEGWSSQAGINNLEINIGKLPAGTYLLSLTYNGTVKTKRLIKQ